MSLNIQDVILDSQASDPSTPDDGCIWYNSTSAQFKMRAGGNSLAVAPSVPPTQVTSTSVSTTTSTSFVLVPSMTATPVAGNYLVVITAELTTDGANEECSFCIYKGGVIVAHTERQQQNKTTGVYSSVGTTAYITCNGSEAVEMRFKSPDGVIVANARNRSMILVRQA